MTPDSAPELITQAQAYLVELQWLVKDEFTEGTLDEATITAVYNFQDDYNKNYGGTLVLIDAEAPAIDLDTLNLLTEAFETRKAEAE